MRQATCERNFNGWSKLYIRRRNETERNLFTNTFDRIEKLHETPYGQSLRPGEHLPIPDEIKSKVMRDWFKNHRTSGRHLRLVDIWNHEKKLDRVHGESPEAGSSNQSTMCWAIPVSVFEKSYRERHLKRYARRQRNLTTSTDNGKNTV